MVDEGDDARRSVRASGREPYVSMLFTANGLETLPLALVALIRVSVHGSTPGTNIYCLFIRYRFSRYASPSVKPLVAISYAAECASDSILTTPKILVTHFTTHISNLIILFYETPRYT